MNRQLLALVFLCVASSNVAVANDGGTGLVSYIPSMPSVKNIAKTAYDSAKGAVNSAASSRDFVHGLNLGVSLPVAFAGIVLLVPTFYTFCAETINFFSDEMDRRRNPMLVELNERRKEIYAKVACTQTLGTLLIGLFHVMHPDKNDNAFKQLFPAYQQ